MTDLISREEAMALPVIPIEYREFVAHLDDAYEKGWEAYRAYIGKLPCAYPKKGKWIDIDSQMYTWICRCSECGYERSMMSTQGRYPRFCENCGAYMRGNYERTD